MNIGGNFTSGGATTVAENNSTIHQDNRVITQTKHEISPDIMRTFDDKDTRTQKQLIEKVKELEELLKTKDEEKKEEKKSKIVTLLRAIRDIAPDAAKMAMKVYTNPLSLIDITYNTIFPKDSNS